MKITLLVIFCIVNVCFATLSKQQRVSGASESAQLLKSTRGGVTGRGKPAVFPPLDQKNVGACHKCLDGAECCGTEACCGGSKNGTYDDNNCDRFFFLALSHSLVCYN
jgi:hypothetical protein